MTGELVCGDCGLVILEELVSQYPESRAFTLEEEENKARVGPPTRQSRFNKGLFTAIKINRDAFGRPLPPETRRQMWRLKRWHARYQMHQKERNLRRAMDEIRRITEKLSIPSAVQENAAVIYRKALDKGLIRGRSITSIAAAALYVACRLAETPKSLKEIAEAGLRDIKSISRDYRMLLRELKIELPIHDPLTYLPKIAEKANVSGTAQGLAAEILRRAKEERLTSGKAPRGVAGAVLYIACLLKDEKRTQKQIAEAAGVTEVTIRNRIRELKERLSLNV